MQDGGMVSVANVYSYFACCQFRVLMSQIHTHLADGYDIGLAALAEDTLADGNIGVAYTYNEALVGYEFVRDTARLVRERGMKNVLVTNGTAELSVLEELLPYIDAMNIDLKGFSETYVNQCLGGNLQMNLAFIEAAARRCHVELTTLIVPGKNDTEEEMRQMSAWIASLNGGAGKEIPYQDRKSVV